MKKIKFINYIMLIVLVVAIAMPTFAVSSSPQDGVQAATKGTEKDKGTKEWHFGGTITEKDGSDGTSPRLRTSGSGSLGKGGGSKKTDANSTNTEGSNAGSNSNGSSTTGTGDGAPSAAYDAAVANQLAQNNNPLGDVNTAITQNYQNNPQVLQQTEVVETRETKTEETKEETKETKEETKETKEETKDTKEEKETEETKETKEVKETEDNNDNKNDKEGKKSEGKALEGDSGEDEQDKITPVLSNTPGGYGGGKKVFEINTAGGMGINGKTNGLGPKINFYIVGAVSTLSLGFILRWIVFANQLKKFKRKEDFDIY